MFGRFHLDSKTAGRPDATIEHYMHDTVVGPILIHRRKQERGYEYFCTACGTMLKVDGATAAGDVAVCRLCRLNYGQLPGLIET